MNLINIKLTGNSLIYFPLFCEYIYLTQNEECKLKTIYFDSNKLESIKNTDLMHLENLEYLNLDNNQIIEIEESSFEKIINLEYLILSNNKLKFINKSIFGKLGSIKFINLSSNSIGIVESNIFSYLKKLEVIDLSRNKIYEMEENSFYKLNNLKFFYINENSPNMTINNGSFYELNSIEFIYLSKSILDSNTSLVFIGLLKQKNKNHFTKILNVNYLKSLNLLSFDEVDCNFTLYFIRKNVHFNLRTDYDWHQYITNCEDDEIKIKEEFSKRNDFNRIQLTKYWYFYLVVPCTTITIFLLVYLLCFYVAHEKILKL